MMNCDQITRAASDFIDRRLRLHERLMVLAHLAMCRGCRAYIQQLRQTLFGLRSLPAPTASAPTDELMERFRGHARKPKV